MKKKLVVFMMALAVVAAQGIGSTVNNGTFEDGSYDYGDGTLMGVNWEKTGGGSDAWKVYWENDGTDSYSVVSVAGSSGGGGGYSMLFQDDPESLISFEGLSDGATVVYLADVKSIDGANGPGNLLRVDWFDANNNWQANSDLYWFESISDTWTTYSTEFTVSSPKVRLMFAVSTGWGGANDTDTITAVDNIRIAMPAGSKPDNPSPVSGTVNLTAITDELKWINPLPVNMDDTITCNVYLEADDGDEAFISEPIATGLADDTISLSEYGISLLPGTKYYWKVDCVDPNSGSPATTEGLTWDFTTASDVAPVVDAGADLWRWLDPEDTSHATIDLDGTVEDDGKSELTTKWTLLSKDPSDAVVIIDDPNAVDTFVTVDSTGYYTFQLEAKDEIWTVSDSLAVIVHETACEAAYSDPDDIPATYSGLHGDIDGDCDIDLVDFAYMASHWLDCMSVKLGCVQ